MSKKSTTSKTQGRLNIVNRDEYPQFMPSPHTHYKIKTRIKSLRMIRVSPDEEYKKLKKRNQNIDITDPRIYSNRNQKPINGIFSPLFGADSTQDTPVYSCECRELIGARNIGRICPKCHTECRTIDADLRRYGTIDIAPWHILTYHGYVAFSKLFGADTMTEIITTTSRINKQGHVIKGELPTILDLYDDYDEKYKDKIKLDKNLVFMSKIPVYTSRLRPLIRYGYVMTVLEVNKNFLSMVTSRNTLKTAPLIQNLKRTVEVQRTLNQLQQDFLEVRNHCIKQLSGKKGSFRQLLASGRVDNSARLVITLGDDLMPHEVDLPYQTIMVLAEDIIAQYLSKIENIPISKAISQVIENANTVNPKFVKIINILLNQKYGLWALINRNPTISESGIPYMRIRRINKDPLDYTAHLPVDVLALMAADDPKRKSA